MLVRCAILSNDHSVRYGNQGARNRQHRHNWTRYPPFSPAFPTPSTCGAAVRAHRFREGKAAFADGVTESITSKLSALEQFQKALW